MSMSSAPLCFKSTCVSSPQCTATKKRLILGRYCASITPSPSDARMLWWESLTYVSSWFFCTTLTPSSGLNTSIWGQSDIDIYSTCSRIPRRRPLWHFSEVLYVQRRGLHQCIQREEDDRVLETAGDDRSFHWDLVHLGEDCNIKPQVLMQLEQFIFRGRCSCHAAAHDDRERRESDFQV